MYVIKRDGRHEDVNFNKVIERIEKLSFDLDSEYVNAVVIAQKVIAGIHNGITTQELDLLTVSVVTTGMDVDHPDLRILAGRIAVSNIQKNTFARFSDAIEHLYNFYNNKVARVTPIISKDLYEVVMAYRDEIDNAVVPENDFQYDIFAIETLRRSYLQKAGDKTIETPQYMLMRVALGVYSKTILEEGTISDALEMYRLMSERYYIHSSPTLFNSGTPRPQLASCFLLTNKEDSIDGIYETLGECAAISKMAGGIGLSIHDVRSTGSLIEGTNGRSSGIVPMLQVFNATCRYVDQAGKRKGAIAIYLEPHHADVLKFVELRKTTGNMEQRTPDLFIALWISDYFMECVETDQLWALFDPNTAKGLSDVHGDEYVALYNKYKDEGRAIQTIPARELWTAIMVSQIETGTPYMLNKDQCNKKSNQQNLGTIKSSNLCAEIVQYSAPDETAVCNLASINLSRFVKGNSVDYQKLTDVSRVAIRNLNKVIDVSYYPSENASRSNFRHRPVGLGVSGLHDVFFLLGIAYDSDEARVVNKRIFETIYRGAILESIALSKKHGPYSSFEGSPASKGVLQFDLWGIDQSTLFWEDWGQIKKDVCEFGLRNSLVVSLMPTASSASIMGVTESFEIQTSNLFTRKVLSGEFVLINKYLVRDLVSLGLWNKGMMNRLLDSNGSVQNIEGIPQNIKDVYRTVWEYKMRAVIDMAADRSPFIDQSQSLNMFLENPNIQKLTSMYNYAYKKGLKTMSYYLHSRGAADAINFACTNCSA